MILIALMLQLTDSQVEFPANVAVSMRYDCHIVDAASGKRGGYWTGDYVFIFPADVGLVTGKSIPYLHTPDDSRSMFDVAVIEYPDPSFGPSIGFALRLGADTVMAFTSRGVEKDGWSRVRGSSRERTVTALSGQCRVWSSPNAVNLSFNR